MARTPVRVGLVGAGRIGRHHAEVLARRIPGARLTAVADAVPAAAERLAAALGAQAARTRRPSSRPRTSTRL